MKARSCAELAELRSAFVDGALGDADRERLLAHLVDCSDCRREVAELRHVRSLLTGSTDPGLTPVDLSYRLVSIAGEEATEPLWTRPFRRTVGGGELPSQRHLVRTRVMVGVLGCSLTVLAVLGIGYLSAPAAAPVAALDPTHRAVTEFTSVVSGFPLDGRVSAALQGRPASATSVGTEPTPVALPAKRLSEAKTMKLMVQAGQAGDQLTYSATQIVSLSREGERISNIVQVSSREGAGTELSPSGSGHHPAGAATYIASDSSTRMADADLIDRLAARYELRGWKSQSYSERDAYVVEAVEPTVATADGSLDSVAARWWLDARTKLLLGQETYDGRGNVVLASRLADLRFDAAADNSVVASPAARTTATLTLSRAVQLRRDGWVCADRLAGLSLLRLRTDQTDDPKPHPPRLQRRTDHRERGRAAGAADRCADRQHPQRDAGRLGHHRDADHRDLDLGGPRADRGHRRFARDPGCRGGCASA